ncbi:hypothetical protein FGIG_10850 [Fasciola gigantica]|uniref:Uncharacterized protein n=1 Tax=Fasciola gigantica TaxID=46835 RepID=A0A504YN32_FASGI|nr:hypothetical protein FGIG_10850 [Fasciola gigantica]
MGAQNIAFNSLVVVVGIFSIFLGSTTKCPDNFIEVRESVCIIRINRGATYCEAHQICEQEGKKRGLPMFLPGHNAPKRPFISRHVNCIHWLQRNAKSFK